MLRFQSGGPVPISVANYAIRLIQLKYSESENDLHGFVSPAETQNLQLSQDSHQFQSTMTAIDVNKRAFTYFLFAETNSPTIHYFVLIFDLNSNTIHHADSIYGDSRNEEHNIESICRGIFRFANITDGTIR